MANPREIANTALLEAILKQCRGREQNPETGFSASVSGNLLFGRFSI
jgi:hypothetical protein